MRRKSTMPTMRSEAMPVGDGFVVEFSIAKGKLSAVWSPDLPVGRPHLIPAYRRARDEFLRRVARRLGGNVAVLEVPR